MGYEWLAGALDSLRDIEPHEVLQVLGADRRWPVLAHDPDTGLRVLSIWARTSAGRPLIVVVKQHGTWDWWIVAARPMRAAELQQWEKWEASN